MTAAWVEPTFKERERENAGKNSISIFSTLNKKNCINKIGDMESTITTTVNRRHSESENFQTWT